VKAAYLVSVISSPKTYFTNLGQRKAFVIGVKGIDSYDLDGFLNRSNIKGKIRLVQRFPETPNGNYLSEDYINSHILQPAIIEYTGDM
jgi:hypothetical protein